MPDTYHTAGIGGDRHLNFYSNRDNLRGHLEQVLRVYVDHYNVHRPHRALRLESPGSPAGPSVISETGALCAAATAWVACSMSITGKLHERVSASYAALDDAPRSGSGVGCSAEVAASRYPKMPAGRDDNRRIVGQGRVGRTRSRAGVTDGRR